MFTSDTGLVTESDVEAYLGRARFARMNYYMVKHQHRAGQAFFNVLDADDQKKLRGTVADPFEAQFYPAVLNALEFLLNN